MLNYFRPPCSRLHPVGMAGRSTRAVPCVSLRVRKRRSVSCWFAIARNIKELKFLFLATKTQAQFRNSRVIYCWLLNSKYLKCKFIIGIFISDGLSSMKYSKIFFLLITKCWNKRLDLKTNEFLTELSVVEYCSCWNEAFGLSYLFWLIIELMAESAS